MQCPRCQLPLEPGPVTRCRRCEGCWVQSEKLTKPGDWKVEARPAIPCAVCGSEMTTLRVRGVAVDRCPTHGVWFDRGELEQVQRERLGRTLLDSVVDLFWLY